MPFIVTDADQPLYAPPGHTIIQRMAEGLLTAYEVPAESVTAVEIELDRLGVNYISSDDLAEATQQMAARIQRTMDPVLDAFQRFGESIGQAAASMNSIVDTVRDFGQNTLGMIPMDHEDDEAFRARVLATVQANTPTMAARERGMAANFGLAYGLGPNANGDELNFTAEGYGNFSLPADSPIARRIRDGDIRNISELDIHLNGNQVFDGNSDHVDVGRVEDFQVTDVSVVADPPDPYAVFGRRVTVPLFEIEPQFSPTIHLDEIRARRFPLMDRSHRTPQTYSRFPEWFVMGSWVKHKMSGTIAQVIDAKDEITAVLEVWEYHEHRLEWDIPWQKNSDISPEGYLHVTWMGSEHWEPCDEPILHPTIWEHLDEHQEAI